MTDNPIEGQTQTVIQALSAPDGLFAIGNAQRNGQDYKVIKTAPPHLAAFFAATCEKHGDTCFLVDGDQRLSFGETYTLARTIAGVLVTKHEVKKGDRIALAGRNSASWIVIYMAIIMAGGVATLLNGFWRSDEMAEALTDTGASLVFADGPRAANLAQSSHAYGAKLHVFDESLPVAEALAALLADSGSDIALPALTGDDLATILFTSGSTGKSKGAFSTHQAVVQAAYHFTFTSVMLLQLLAANGKSPKYPPSTLLNVPLFHVTCEVTILLQSFALGRKLTIMPKWDAKEAMRLIEQERVSYFTGVPLMGAEILNHPDRDKYDLSSCMALASGGAPRPVDQVRRIPAEIPSAQPVTAYGLTETNAVGTFDFGEHYFNHPDTVGSAGLPLVDVAIFDDAGAQVGAGVAGEVGIRSIACFSGYWNNPSATAKAFTADGHFLSGDIGQLDEEGYLFLIDRKKDVIIRGGEKITSIEVEAALYAHPEIAEASVFGISDARYGEVAAAVVMFQPGKALSIDALKAALGKQIAAFKVPAKIWVSDAPLPRLGTGKIDKVSIRAKFSALHESH